MCLQISCERGALLKPPLALLARLPAMPAGGLMARRFRWSRRRPGARSAGEWFADSAGATYSLGKVSKNSESRSRACDVPARIAPAKSPRTSRGAPGGNLFPTLRSPPVAPSCPRADLLCRARRPQSFPCPTRSYRHLGVKNAIRPSAIGKKKLPLHRPSRRRAANRDHLVDRGLLPTAEDRSARIARILKHVALSAFDAESQVKERRLCRERVAILKRAACLREGLENLWSYPRIAGIWACSGRLRGGK